MEIGVMVTNGGPHSAEKWAETTASHIVTIADSIAGEKRGSAIKLQAAVIDILTGHHTTVQHGERDKIKKHGNARLQHDMTPNDHVSVDSVIADIIAAGQGTPWQDAFNYQGQPRIEDEYKIDANGNEVLAKKGQDYRPSFKKYLTDVLTDHFMSNAFIERSWHADQNAHTPEAQAFHKQFRS
jgi:hypothetical protein